MESSSTQSSSAKRKQLHPKKQVILDSAPSQRTGETTTKLEVSSISSPQETPKMSNDNMEIVPTTLSSGPSIITATPKLPLSNLEPSMIDSSSTNAQTSNVPTQQNTVTNEVQDDMNSPKAIPDSIEINQDDAGINIETMKMSLKQKLDIALSNYNFNKEQNTRISLAQRKKIVEQKMRKFFANASLHTTVVHNTKKSNEKSDVQINNSSNSKDSIEEKNIETQQMMHKIKTDEPTNKIELTKDENLSLKAKSNLEMEEKDGDSVLCTTVKNKTLLTSNKDDETAKVIAMGIENSVAEKNIETQQMIPKIKTDEPLNKIELTKDENLSLEAESNPEMEEKNKDDETAKVIAKSVENSVAEKNIEMQQMMPKIKTDESTNKIELSNDENLSLNAESNPEMEENNCVGVLCTTIKNITLLASNKDDEITKVKTEESNEEKKIDSNATTKASTFTKMKNNDCGELKIKKVIITPRISNATNKKSKKEFDAVIEIAMPANKNDKEKNDAFAINADEHANKQSIPAGSSTLARSSKLTEKKETDEKLKDAIPTINLNDPNKYVACLQTVRPSSVSAIKAIASIRKLKEMTPEKLRETSENILDYNIEMIDLVNKLTKANNSNLANAIPSKVSINKLEDALSFALGKKPRTITIIRKPMEPNDAKTKLSITYIDRLDSALDSALGSNCKLIPFVKQLINSSVSNFMKSNPSKNNSLAHKLVKISNLKKHLTRKGKDVATGKNNSEPANLHGESTFLKTTDSKYKIQERSDTEDCLGFESSEIPKTQNAKLINAYLNLNKEIEENREIVQKKKNDIVPVVQLSPKIKKKINIISIEKGAALKSVAAITKPSQINRKHIKTTCGTKPIFLRRLIKPKSISNTSDNIVEKLPEKKSEIQNLPIPESSNSAAAVKKSAITVRNSSDGIESGVKKSIPVILNRTLQVTKSDQTITNNSNPQMLSIIGPVRLYETIVVPENSKSIVIKKLIKKSSVEQTNTNATKPLTHENAEENIEVLDLTVGDPEAAVEATMQNTETAKKPIFETIVSKSEEESSLIGKPENRKRKFTVLGEEQVGILKTNQSGSEGKAYNMAERKVISFTDTDEMPALKRPKMMSSDNTKSLEATIKSAIKQAKPTNDPMKTVVDFSYLQTCIKAILESDMYNQITSPNTLASVKLDKTVNTENSTATYQLKGLSSFAKMHDVIVSILKSPGYQQVLALGKCTTSYLSANKIASTSSLNPQENSLLTNETGTASNLPTKSPTKSLLDPNTLDITTLKSSSTVPDTLLPLLDKEESDDVYEKYILEHVWNENNNQDLSFFDNENKK